MDASSLTAGQVPSGVPDSGPVHRGLNLFAWITAFSVLLLILVGALVTSLGVGMAVPDWPTTFGENMFTYDWANSEKGVFVEHGHRLMGALIGLLTLSLALWLWIVEKRSWVRWLGLAALLAVIAQGVMGGMRVIEISRAWAVVHGGFGQAFFGLIVGLAVVTSPKWIEQQPSASLASLRRLATVTSSLIFLQIVSGTVIRHFGTGLAVHILLALGVLMHVFFLNRRALDNAEAKQALSPWVGIFTTLAGLQLVLGLGAFMVTAGRGPEAAGRAELIGAVTTVLHVAVGGLLLASSVVITVRTWQPQMKGAQS